MPPNFLTEGIIIEGRGGKGNGVCIDDPRLISGFFHRTDIKVSDGIDRNCNETTRSLEDGERNEDTILPDDCSLIIQRVPPL